MKFVNQDSTLENYGNLHNTHIKPYESQIPHLKRQEVMPKVCRKLMKIIIKQENVGLYKHICMLKITQPW